MEGCYPSITRQIDQGCDSDHQSGKSQMRHQQEILQNLGPNHKLYEQFTRLGTMNSHLCRWSVLSMLEHLPAKEARHQNKR